MSKYLHLILALAMGCACLWLVVDLGKRLNPFPDLPPVPVIPPDIIPPKPPRPSPLPDGVNWGKVNRISGEQLDQIVKLQIPVLAKFGAEWCGPCGAIKPHLEKFAVDAHKNSAEPVDDILVVELEITEGRGPFDRLKIKALPTLVVFWGDEIKRIEGALNDRQIAKFVDEAIRESRK